MLWRLTAFGKRCVVSCFFNTEAFYCFETSQPHVSQNNFSSVFRQCQRSVRSANVGKNVSGICEELFLPEVFTLNFKQFNNI